ncbi:MAG: efflux RND transporter periplasmic adaptor subunit [Undibacterium sp.]|nr:efflux RND transporter periplasmic adaptor subunit [Undibacterium sp.]
MNDNVNLHTVTGAAMDKPIPKNYKKQIFRISLLVVIAIALVVLAWSYLPKGLQVSQSDVRIQAVEQGVFLDDIIVRANAQPLNSVILDAVESGRVEEVFVQDGAMVKQGQFIFRLSNPQRNLELLQRKGEYAINVANLANMRVQDQNAKSEHQRRVSALEFDLDQARKKHQRNIKLAEQGFISSVQLEEARDAVERQEFLLKEEKLNRELEVKVRSTALEQLETGIYGLQNGLKIVSNTVDNLAVRSPMDGKLTDFKLQVGESVNAGKRLGRIDDPKSFKLAAQVDEFYLNRVAVGHKGSARMDEKTYAVEVMSIFPQIKEGRFLVELKFTKEAPLKLNPGQSLDTNISLGDPAPALILPMGAYINDTGGTWVFVQAKDGNTFERRNIKIGHRSNRQVEIISGLEKGDKVLISSYTAYQNVQRLQLSGK